MNRHSTRQGLAGLLALLAAACGGGNRVESIESELNDVRRQVASMKQEQDAQRELLEQMKEEMEDVRKVTAKAQADTDALSSAVEGMSERMSEATIRLDKLSSQLGNQAASFDPTATVVPSIPEEDRSPVAVAPVGSPTELYDRAYGDFTKGNYSLALLGFQEFLAQYPANDLSDNAQYWLAECLFAQKKYEDAIREYDKIFAKYPTSDKVPGAYLKKGFAFLELNQTAQGVVQLQYLTGKYPGSDEANVAARRLESLGLRPR